MLTTRIRLAACIDDELSMRGLTLAIYPKRPGDELGAICKILPFGDVEVLTIEGTMPRVFQLTTIAMQMPRLRVVRVYDTPTIIQYAHHLRYRSIGTGRHKLLPTWQPKKVPQRGRQRAIGKIVYKTAPTSTRTS